MASRPKDRTMTQTPDNPPRFDPESVHAKYAEERQKRMIEGRAGIQDLTRDGSFTHYLRDPFTPFRERDPIRDDVYVAIVGCGIAGVVAGAKLHEAGLGRIRLIHLAGWIHRIFERDTWTR